MKKRIAKKDNIARLELSMKTMYQNKYYNLFMRSLEWGGIDAEQQDYIMRQFWSLGCVAAFEKEGIDDCLHLQRRRHRL